MTRENISLSGNEFAFLAEYQPHLWNELVKATIQHFSLGIGKPQSTQIRENNTALVKTLFKDDPHLYTFDSECFMDGTITDVHFLDIDLGVINKWREQHVFAKIKRESEIAAKLKLEIENEKLRQIQLKHREDELRQLSLNELIKNHTQFLEEKGKPQAGIRLAAKSRPRRITHCWHCKGHLDNAIDYECNACSWILCRCGACGCGYGESLYSSPTEHYDPSLARPQNSRPYFDDDIPF